jgi:hypothetical protein
MPIGRVLIALGLTLVAIGFLVQLAPILRFGRLPGDLSFGGSGWRVYIPIGTSILVSIVLTLVFAFVNFFMSKR